MALPEFTLRQLLEAGVHFGHQTHRWNPRMGPYIYGDRNGIHIIDLTQTVPLLDQALHAVQQTVAKGGRILFVGTKRQAQKAVADAAERSAQYYMNHRWLGGTLTNWKTVSHSIARLKSIDEKLAGGAGGLTKKERLGLEREQTKLQQSLGGIREMGGTPDLIFVIDTNKEDLAILEARKLGIPVIAVLDTNSSPDGIDYPIPGNDDAARAIALYCDLIARAALDGMAAQMGAAGVDIGALEEAPVEEAAGGRGRRSRGLTPSPRRRGAGAGSAASDRRLRFEESRQMSITATMVKELREASGAGMMDAKKALTETGGDMEAAIDWLRTKGLAKAAKKSGPHRRRGAGRRRGQGRRRRRGRGELRDRLRGAQLGLPGDRSRDRRGRDRLRRHRGAARRAARRQDRAGGGDREDRDDRREPAPAAHGLGRGRERRLLRAQRRRREPRQDRRAGGAEGRGQRHRQADRHARRGDRARRR